MQLQDSIHNYLEMDERIATGGQPTAAELLVLQDAGFEVVVNLAAAPDPNFPDEKSKAKHLHMTYVHIPVEWDNPKLSNFKKFLDAMDQYQDRKVFIHCVINKRVAVFMALYRIVRQGWDYAAALADVQRIWQPNETWSRFMQDVLQEYGRGSSN